MLQKNPSRTVIRIRRMWRRNNKLKRKLLPKKDTDI
jgi:hypothetical protein